jgi:hypothetical protein
VSSAGKVKSGGVDPMQYYMFMQFNAWEYLYYQNRDESIPKEL